jgi:hypothetical protein
MSPNLAVSVHARLLNVAKAQESDFNQVLVRFALERILYRLTQSKYANRFLLKGALLFTLWYDMPHRATVGKPVSVPLTCTDNGPDDAVNATCAVTGAPAGAKTVCTPAVPVVWLAVDSSITCTVTFTPTSTDTLMLTATVGTDSQDADHTNDTESVDITPVAAQSARLGTATPVPTLGDIALIVLTILLGVSAVVVHRRGR